MFSENTDIFQLKYWARIGRGLVVRKNIRNNTNFCLVFECFNFNISLCFLIFFAFLFRCFFPCSRQAFFSIRSSEQRIPERKMFVGIKAICLLTSVGGQFLAVNQNVASEQLFGGDLISAMDEVLGCGHQKVAPEHLEVIQADIKPMWLTMRNKDCIHKLKITCAQVLRDG